MTLMLLFALALAPATVPQNKIEVAAAEGAPSTSSSEARPQTPECAYRLQEVLNALSRQRRDDAQTQRGDDQQADLAHVGG